MNNNDNNQINQNGFNFNSTNEVNNASVDQINSLDNSNNSLNNNLNTVEFLDNTVNDTINSSNISNNSQAELNSLQINNSLNQININSNDIGYNSISNNENSEMLLPDYVGKKYNKLSRRKFNFASLFFGPIYFFYRKMFLYGIITLLIEAIVFNFIPIILFPIYRIILALFTNKIYLNFARKNISKIRKYSPNYGLKELKEICAKKGGASVGFIFLGLFINFVITSAVAFIMGIIGLTKSLPILDDLIKLFKNPSAIINPQLDNVAGQEIKLEDVTLNGYSCMMSKCVYLIDGPDGSEDYGILSKYNDSFGMLQPYSKYLKINIYYVKKENEKIINKYEVLLKSTNEDVTSIRTVDELREKIGLYSYGYHTEKFTVKEVGITGFGSNGSESYTYSDLVLLNDKNNEYEMKYILKNDESSVPVEEGNNYEITFEAKKGTFDDEFIIRDIK